MAFDEDCAQLATILRDYRGTPADPATAGAAHVRRWAEQLPEAKRRPVVKELIRVFSKTYFSQTAATAFFRGVITDSKLTAGNHAEFWRGVRILNGDRVDADPNGLLAIFERVLREECGLSIADTGRRKAHRYIYIADAVYSGARLRADLAAFARGLTAPSAKVTVIAFATHQLAISAIEQMLDCIAKSYRKTIEVDFIAKLTFEDRKSGGRDADVLRPKAVSPLAEAYFASMRAAPLLRTGRGVGNLRLYSSPQARDLLEGALLDAGIEALRRSRAKPQHLRPLGASLFDGAGFGAMLVTYRAIAPHCPLALWASDGWYPLLPRPTH